MQIRRRHGFCEQAMLRSELADGLLRVRAAGVQVVFIPEMNKEILMYQLAPAILTKDAADQSGQL